MLNYLTLTLDLYDGQGNYPVSGSAAFTPSAVLTDAGVEVIGQQPVTAVFRAAAMPSMKLLATDSAGPLPTGWTWGVAFSGVTGAPAAFSFFLPAAAVSFTATNASPCVFTVGSGLAPANGTGVQLSGGSLPAGFSAATTYYVVNASGSTFELAAAQGGTALGSTGTGSGTVTSVSQLLSNLVPVAQGSTSQPYLLNPMTTTGDMVYGGAAGAAERLAGNTGTVSQVLTSTGTGSAAQAPAWSGAEAVSGRTPSKYEPLLYGAIWGYPWKFYPESYGAKGDARIIGDATVATGQLTTMTSASGPFKSSDTGKKIMLNGAQGNNAQPLITTITYVNPTTVTLGSAASGALANASAVYATDDTAAINSCLTALSSYALASGDRYHGQLILSAMYGLATPPSVLSGIAGSTASQIPLPRPAASGATQKLVIDILGIGSADATNYWESAVPNIQGAALISMCIPPYVSGTNPFPSVIGFQYADDGSLTGGFANTKAWVDGVTVVIPFLAPQAAFDFRYLGGAGGGSFSAMAFAAVNGAYSNLGSLNGLSGQQSGSSVGLFMPLTGNNDDCTVTSFANQGFTYGLNATEHCAVHRLASVYDIVGIQAVGGGAHVGAVIPYASIESCVTALQYTGSSPYPFFGLLDCEQISTWHVQDTQQALYGRVDVHTNSGAPAVEGAANCEVIWDGQARAVQGAPSYTLGAPFQNPWWRNSAVTLAGGTVTGISIGPKQASLTSLGITSGTFRLPSGWWLEIDGSVKPATFIAVPD